MTAGTMCCVCRPLKDTGAVVEGEGRIKYLVEM